MSPSPASSQPDTSVTSQPLPPLPSASGAGPSSSGPASPLVGLLSGIAPIKNAVDGIRAACQAIVQSGAIPGAEQICGQIVALATQLVPMAAQNLLQPMAGGPGGGGGGGMQMPPPPGGPQPIGQGQ